MSNNIKVDRQAAENPIFVVVFLACRGVQKSTHLSSLLDASRMKLFEQPVVTVAYAQSTPSFWI